MDWRKYLDLEPVRDPTMTNPVGTSTMQRVTNPSPDVSPLVSAMLMTPEQRVGAFYALGTRRAKPWTGRDLPELSKLANEAYDYAAGFVNGTAAKPSGITPSLETRSGELTKAKPASWRPNEVADDIVARLQGDGFRVSVNRGNGPVGPSAYLNVFDPETRRYLMKEVRVSDHSTGAARFAEYYHVLGPEDVDGVFSLAQQMRARGLAASSPDSVLKTSNPAEEAARLLSEKAAQAYPDEWGKWADKSGAAAKKARQELRRRYAKDYGGPK